jgi:PAS domain S-box-containing protein
VDRSDQGLPPIVAGVTTQIDSLKENERRLADALAEAEAARERLDRLAHYAPAGLYEFRIFPDGRSEMPYYNAQLPVLLGITAEDIEADPNGAPVLNVFADDKVELAARIRRSKKHLTPYEHEYRVNHPERGVIWVLTQGVPVREADGATVWYGSSIEITERIEMEKQLEITKRERTVTLADIEKDKAVEQEKKAIQDIIRQRVAVERAVAEEEEHTKDTREFAAAERKKKVAITEAEQAAEENLIKDIKAAEARQKAAMHEAQEREILAEAEKVTSVKLAEAKEILAKGIVAEQSASGLAHVKVMEAEADAVKKKGEASTE